MIDFWGVFSNFLWVMGLAILLATLSYASYAAAVAKTTRMREKLDEFPYALALDVGLVLFCAGLAATEDRWWARLLWIGLGIMWIVDGVSRALAVRKQHGG